MLNIWISWLSNLCRCFSLRISLLHTLHFIYYSDRKYLNFIGHIAIVVSFLFHSFGANTVSQSHQLNKYICLWAKKILIINFINISCVTHHMNYYFPFEFSLSFDKETVLSVSWVIQNIWPADFGCQEIVRWSFFFFHFDLGHQTLSQTCWLRCDPTQFKTPQMSIPCVLWMWCSNVQTTVN